MVWGPFVRRGDTIALTSFSTKAIHLQSHATARMVDRKGRVSFQTLTIPEIVTTTGVGLEQEESTTQFRRDGRIIDALALSPDAGKRGQTFVNIHTRRGSLQGLICSGYIYGGRNVPLGLHEGPRDGHGHTIPRAVALNITPVDIQHTLAGTNRLRRIDGFAWYYHCSADVADRTLRASLRDLGTALPTGMTSGANTTVKQWPSAGVLTLSADQEGLIYVNANTGKSFATSLDNGAATIEDITTNPDPLPYWAVESDVGEFFFDVTLAEAADRHTIYIFAEEWIDL